MQYPYYPGCSLHEKAADLNESAINAAQKLDIELRELEEWQCCGAVYPQSTDGLFPLAAPLRNLVRAEEKGDKMVTLCSACFNIHKRVNHMVEEDEELLERINSYNREDEYHRGVEVLHLIEVFTEIVGLDRVNAAVERDMEGLKVAPYYGCMLLRPKEELNFDDPEAPSIFEALIDSINCEAVEYPHRSECCGAYATVHLESPPKSAVKSIVNSAVRRGAEVMAVSCPLCHYNLVESQEKIQAQSPGFSALPIIYFTELMEYAFGISEKLTELETRVK